MSGIEINPFPQEFSKKFRERGSFHDAGDLILLAFEPS